MRQNSRITVGEAQKTSRAWMSYDSVADLYLRVAVPWFMPMAQDLVAAVAPMPGEAVADLGTGTGLVAGLVARAVRPRGVVIGIDPSFGMLRRVDRTGVRVAAARAPGVPLAASSVDLVVANLVLSHVPDLNSGVSDMVRVVRSGGRLGCTAWAAPVPGGPDHTRPLADDIVAGERAECGLDLPPPREPAVPHEEQLRDPDSLRDVLIRGGLGNISMQRRRYEFVFTVDDFVCGWGSQGRYLRQQVGEQRWEDFARQAAAALRAQLGASVSCVNDVWIATGGKA